MKPIFRLALKIIAVISAIYFLIGIALVIFNPYFGQYAPEWLQDLPYSPPSQCFHDACTQIGYIIYRTNWLYWQLSPQNGYVPVDLWLAGIILGISSLWLYLTRQDRSRIPLIKAVFVVAVLYLTAGLLSIMSEGGLLGRSEYDKQKCEVLTEANRTTCLTPYVDDQYRTFIGWKFEINDSYEGVDSYSPVDLQIAGIIAAVGLVLLLSKRKFAGPLVNPLGGRTRFSLRAHPRITVGFVAAAYFALAFAAVAAHGSFNFVPADWSPTTECRYPHGPVVAPDPYCNLGAASESRYDVITWRYLAPEYPAASAWARYYIPIDAAVALLLAGWGLWPYRRRQVTGR